MAQTAELPRVEAPAEKSSENPDLQVVREVRNGSLAQLFGVNAGRGRISCSIELGFNGEVEAKVDLGNAKSSLSPEELQERARQFAEDTLKRRG